MATAKPPFRDRFQRFIGELREQEHRQMAWNFTKSILLLTIAMLAALYANSTARDGRVIPSAIAALIALSIAVWVGLRFVPRLAAGVDWDWLPFFTQYRLTRDGWIYIATTTVVMSAAINTSNNLLYMVLSALLAVMLLSGFLSGLNFRFLRLVARLPDHCFARQGFPLVLSVKNPKRVFPAFSLRVSPVDESPFRFEGYYVPLVGTQDQDTRTVEAELPRRGRHRLDEVQLQSRYPFGFLLKGRPVPVEAECIAFPEILQQEEMDIAIHDILGASERFERGQGMDLYMIRDYVASDSARHVDWKATAKTSSLKTREFATEESRRVVLAFDRYGVHGDENRFESLVSYEASLAVHMARDGIELSMVSDEWSSSSGHSETLLQSILSYLALVEMNPSAWPPPVEQSDGTVNLSLREGSDSSWNATFSSHSTR